MGKSDSPPGHKRAKQQLWAKVDAHFPRNPKCLEAGFWGHTYFLHLILLNRLYDFQGFIPAKYASGSYVAQHTGMDVELGSDASRAVTLRAVTACRHAGLIEVCDEGVRLLGWDESWDFKRDSSRERMRRYRERKKGQVPATNGETPSSPGARVTESDASRDVTNVTVTPVTAGYVDRDIDLDLDKRSSFASAQEDAKAGAGGASASGDAKQKLRKELNAAQIPEPAHLAAQLLWDRLLEQNPEHRLGKLGGKQRANRLLAWANGMRLLHERDGRTWGQITAMIDWAQTHRFWSSRVQSPARLRECWDEMVLQKNKPARPNYAPAVASDIRYGQAPPATAEELAADQIDADGVPMSWKRAKRG